MEPTFTGIKNIGYLKTSFDHAAMSIIKDTDKGWQRISRMPGPDLGLEESYLLNVQLTDDFNGKHYTEFTNALKKARLPFSEFKNPVTKNFLNFFISREFYKENGRPFKDTEFIVNGKDLKLEDKNLSFFLILQNLSEKLPKNLLILLL